MPQCHRKRARPVAVDDRQIGMAQARGRNLDQYLVLARCIKFDFADAQRTRSSVEVRGAHCVKYGGSDIDDSISFK